MPKNNNKKSSFSYHFVSIGHTIRRYMTKFFDTQCKIELDM